MSKTDRPRAAARRIFLAEPLPPQTPAYSPTDDERHYLNRVLRLTDGDPVELADGTGRLLSGTLRDGTVTELEVTFTTSLPARRTLVAALIKGNRWETLIEKAAEIGADSIVPLEATRSVVRLSGSKAASKVERWQKIADGAARQCERLSRPEIAPPVGMDAVISSYCNVKTLLIDETEPNHTFPSWTRDEPLTLVVGPEGGFTDKERTAFKSAGALSAGLGPNLLRAETAAVSALTIVRARDAGII